MLKFYSIPKRSAFSTIRAVNRNNTVKNEPSAKEAIQSVALSFGCFAFVFKRMSLQPTAKRDKANSPKKMLNAFMV